MNKKGFTLIELLVVISIIGILSAIALVSFQSVQKQARDAVRKSDLNQYRTALANYAGKSGGFYSNHSDNADDAANSINMVGTGGPCSYHLRGHGCIQPAVISSCPTDPIYSTDNSYYYHYLTNSTDDTDCDVDATQYLLYAKLEEGNYWYYICANGKTGRKPTSNEPVAGDCW